jgi:hypothetical protein
VIGGGAAAHGDGGGGGGGAGRTAGAADPAGAGVETGAAAAPVRWMVSTSNGTPAARSARVTPSAGAAGSACGSRIVSR